MRNFWKLLPVPLLAATVFAGAMGIDIMDPASNTEALNHKAVAIIHSVACVSPEQTLVTAVAEGFVNGQRRSVPVELIPLSQKGMYAMVQSWPAEGKWVVRFTATNPQYRGYATGALLPVNGASADFKGMQRVYRAPTPKDADAVLLAKNVPD